MKISINLLKQFSNIDVSGEEVVNRIKTHIGEVDFYHNLEDDYKDIVIAEIIQKEDHPDAEKLGIYQIKYGGEDSIQVVAGDKSLEVGDKVAYLKVGSYVPYSIYTEKEPFQISSVKLRGVLSNGMLGSERELNVGNNHEKVLVLSKDAPVGELFVKYFELDDMVIDIENKALTNRGDLFSILGISRELTAILGNQFVSPDWYLNPNLNVEPENNCLNIEIRNDAEALCPRYTAIALDNIQIQESPIWLKSSLIKCGIRPINNVVDVTNYISLLLGQPLHAFDYDKLLKLDPESSDLVHINIRMAKDGEKILGLDEKIYELNDRNLVIADRTHAIAVAGIIGGKDTEVDSNTKRIVLESANFDKSSIRRSSMQLGSFTEAGTKFKHDLDPNQCLPSLLKAVEVLKEISGCTVASKIKDIYNTQYTPTNIQLNTEDINRFLDTDLSVENISNILSSMEYKLSIENEIIQATPPTWRRDISIKEDIYEDIGRVYGYNNIEFKLPKKEIKPPKGNKIFQMKKVLRNILSCSGSNETLTYSFTSPSSFEKCNLSSDIAYKVKNPLSPDLSIMRTCIIQSLIPKAKENLDRGIDKFSLYEFNIPHINTYVGEDKLPTENWYASFVLTASDKLDIKGSPYYAAKSYLERALGALDIKDIKYDLVSEYTEADLPVYIKNLLPLFDANRSAIVSIHGTYLGVVGELDNGVKNNFKLPRYTSGFEVNIDSILNLEIEVGKYKEQPIYPPFTQDICFEMNLDTKYKDLENEIYHVLNSGDLWGKVDCLDIYQKEGSEKKKITYRVTANNYFKTLKEKDIKEIIEKIGKKITNKYNAQIV